MTARLLVVTPRELTRDVRARREVEAAVAAGLDVIGLSNTLGDERPLPLVGVEVVRVEGDKLSGGLRRAGLGGMRRSAPPVRELRGMWRLVRLVKTTVNLARAARALGHFDVVHVNDLDALPGGWVIARRNGARLVYDAHELYRYMEADPPRIYTAIVSALEGRLARRADAVVTNCEPFAAELERLLHTRRPPVVVLNCPDRVEELPPQDERHGPVRVIYQAATDHEGRPVTDLIEAAAHAPDVDVTIRLVEADVERLEGEIARLGLAGRVRLSDPVQPDRLVEGLLGFDVGVLVNRDVTPNTALATPGKLWEYMMAGLATVAPASPGLALVDDLGVGATFRVGDAADFGAKLQRLATDRAELDAMRARARELALERFNSVTQARVLRSVWGLSAG